MFMLLLPKDRSRPIEQELSLSHCADNHMLLVVAVREQLIPEAGLEVTEQVTVTRGYTHTVIIHSKGYGLLEQGHLLQDLPHVHSNDMEPD